MKYALQNITLPVEETVRTKTIVATGFDVEQMSILRLPEGGLRCRAILKVSDGTNTYRRNLTADSPQIAAAIGAENLAALETNIGGIIGALLVPKEPTE